MTRIMADTVSSSAASRSNRVGATSKRKSCRVLRTARIPDSLSAYGLSLPAFLLIMLFLMGPVFAVVLMSFTNWLMGAASFDFVGLKNYKEMVGDPVFWLSLGNTLIYVGVVVPTAFFLSLLIAVLIEAHPSLRAFYRSAYFLPVAATVVAMALVWEFLLHPSFGPVNTILRSLGLSGYSWLHDRDIVLWTLCVVGIWLKLGYYVVLFIAGLKSIPRELYDAAEVDGAERAWSQFSLITWPMLGPVSLFVLVIALIQSVQVFETVAVLTQGGPNKASEVLLYSLYQEGFEFFRVGYASALTVVFLSLVLLITIVKVRVIEPRVHYS